MSAAIARALLIVLSVTGLCASSLAAEKILVGSEIPSRLAIEVAYIFSNSDSLYLNGRLLARDSAYHFENGRGYFDLSRLTVGDDDTLRVTYRPVPAWLNSWYGRPLPELTAGGPSERASAPLEGRTAPPRTTGDITLTGAKTFRFFTSGGGSSQFSQSLDLSLSGELSPGLELKGKVDSIMAGTGAVFSLFPPENASGNYVKVVQRVPVKIVLDAEARKNYSPSVLRIGLSVMPTVFTGR